MDISGKEKVFIVAVLNRKGMEEIKINSMVKFYTLSLLAAGSKYGYELMKELGKNLDKKISASHVYPFLNILIKNKLIKVTKTGKRDKKIYLLTAEGKKFTKKMFARFGDLIEIAIEPKLTACAHCNCKVYEGGHTETIHGKVHKFCCCHCAETFKRSKK